MILRIAATLALIAGCGALAAYLHRMGELPTATRAERHLRRMKDRATAPEAATPVTVEAIAALPKRRPLAEYSRLESRAVILEGYVQRMLRAADDDFHLEIAPRPRAPGDAGIPYVTGEITPRWRRGSSPWSYARLIEAFHPNLGGVTPWEGGTRRARLTGWLLYDYEYEGTPTLFGAPRLSSWELHPVTKIELWSDSLQAFAEYAR